VTQFWKTLHIRTLLDFEKYGFEIHIETYVKFYELKPYNCYNPVNQKTHLLSTNQHVASKLASEVN